MTLYHGSNMEIDRIDLAKSRPHKDFGRGFYTTQYQEQALAMARRTVRLCKGELENKYIIGEISLDELKCFINGKWLPKSADYEAAYLRLMSAKK